MYNTSNSKYNNATGYEAIHTPTNSDYNFATGLRAMCTITNSDYNHAIGNEAMYNTSNCDYNNATGYEAMKTTTNSDYNNATGYQAMWNTSNSNNNNAIGYEAMKTTTNSDYNNATGYQAMYTSTGDYNNAIGYKALYINSGNYNNAFGYNTTIHNGASYSTVIGYNASTNMSNQIVLGTATETVVIPGNLSTVGLTTYAPITLSYPPSDLTSNSLGYHTFDPITRLSANLTSNTNNYVFASQSNGSQQDLALLSGIWLITYKIGIQCSLGSASLTSCTVYGITNDVPTYGYGFISDNTPKTITTTAKNAYSGSFVINSRGSTSENIHSYNIVIIPIYTGQAPILDRSSGIYSTFVQRTRIG